jgi:hypothetical protein
VKVEVPGLTVIRDLILSLLPKSASQCLGFYSSITPTSFRPKISFQIIDGSGIFHMGIFTESSFVDGK